MVNSKPNGEGDNITTPDEQSPALKQLLSVLNSSGKQISMYGDDHPNSKMALETLAKCLAEFIGCYERATCIFTYDAAIINDHYYSATRDSKDLCERLRARGVMAITFAGAPSVENIHGFLGFLHAEPRNIRLEGGPCDYLRKRGISRIVMTESIYSSGEEAESPEESRWEGQSEDMIIAAVIDWLTKQDENPEEKAPKFPITKLLSQPDSAAKLIREAVTKLHASRRDFSDGECINEALNSLKSAIGEDKDEWDKAVPQVRKAIAKLPQDMRPSMTGFSLDLNSNQAQTSGSQRTADIAEAETLVHDILEDTAKKQQPAIVTPPQVFDHYFGAKSVGLLSSWKKELQPGSVLVSSGKTLEVLMNWETNACEHGRIANALAVLLQRAVEVEDYESSLSFTEGLLNVALQDTELGWQRANVLGAIANIDQEAIYKMVRALARMKRWRADEVVGAILDLIPGTALNLIELLGARGAENVAEALQRAFLRLGKTAQPTLSSIFVTGSPTAKERVLELLVATSREWAAQEIDKAIKINDLDFTFKALHIIPRLKMPQVTQMCVGLLSHNEQSVRCAALKALGELGDISALPHLIKIASRSNLLGDHSIEQAAAVEALGQIGGDEALSSLKAIAKSRPLIGRSRFENVRRSAQKFLDDAANQSHDGMLKAA